MIRFVSAARLSAVAIAAAAAAGAWLVAPGGGSAIAQQDQLARGQYLVTIGGCTDCHTDGSMTGQPDMEHFLGGSSIGFEVGPLGIFYAPNLTSDPTGLGDWSDEEVVKAIRQGVRPDGRELAPIMPWRNYASLTDDDVAAMIAFLRSLPHVNNEVPGPFGPGQKPTSPYMTIVMPQP